MGDTHRVGNSTEKTVIEMCAVIGDDTIWCAVKQDEVIYQKVRGSLRSTIGSRRGNDVFGEIISEDDDEAVTARGLYMNGTPEIKM